MLVHPVGEPFRATLIKEERMVSFPFDEGDNRYRDIAEYGDFFAREHPPRASLGQFHELLVIELHSSSPLYQILGFILDNLYCGY